ncbi:hypothetical protein ACFWEV_34880 [Streptomyces bacillaris]|uniref:hypothetical protein n=1 Tax=Streptomyces bacillaris TaxID=68179 RepID=UPI00365076BA
MRLLSKQRDHTIYYWKWRARTAGPGTSAWNTTAQDEVNGIYETGVQVARFEGDRMLNSCTDWTS